MSNIRLVYLGRSFPALSHFLDKLHRGQPLIGSSTCSEASYWFLFRSLFVLLIWWSYALVAQPDAA